MSDKVIVKSLWVKIVAALAIVWHILGLVVFGYEQIMSPEQMAQSYSQVQIDYLANTPLWVVFLNLAAIVLGLAGSFALFQYRVAAYYFFALSLLAVLGVMLDSFLRGGFDILGTTGTGTAIVVTLIPIYLFWLTNNIKLKGLLR